MKQSRFFEKINKIYKPLLKLTKRQRNTKVNKIRNERRDIVADTVRTQKSETERET